MVDFYYCSKDILIVVLFFFFLFLYLLLASMSEIQRRMPGNTETFFVRMLNKAICVPRKEKSFNNIGLSFFYCILK